MRVRFSPQAKRDLHGIFDYIQKDSPVAARRILQRLRERATSLQTFPGQGSKKGNIHVLVVPGTQYLLTYDIIGDEVRILRFFHGRQHRP